MDPIPETPTSPTPPTPPPETPRPGPQKLAPKDRAPADPPRRGPGRPKLTPEEVRARAEDRRRKTEGAPPPPPPPSAPPPPPFDRAAVEGFLRAGIAASNATLTALEVGHVTSLGYPTPRADQLLLPLSDAEADYGVQCGAAAAEQWAPQIARYLPLFGLAVWSGTILVTRYLSLQRLASLPPRSASAEVKAS